MGYSAVIGSESLHHRMRSLSTVSKTRSQAFQAKWPMFMSGLSALTISFAVSL